MRAALHTEFGDVDVLDVVELPDVEPGPGEVVIDVAATSVNHLDVLQRRGPAMLPGFELPHVPGMDVAGTVVAVGSAADEPLLGQRVLANPALHCTTCTACRQGRDGMCTQVRVLGASAPGGYAERCVVPASHVFPIPDTVSFADAASVPTVFATAWHGLFETGDLRAGESVMVHGAGSGVTAAAVLLAKQAGARVLVTARSARKLDHALALGADAAVDSTTDDVVAAARAFTGGEGVDLVFDHVGPALFQSSLFALRPQGRLVFCGTTTGGTGSFDLAHAYHFGLRLLGSDPYHHAEFGRMLEFVWAAGFPSIVDTEMPLDEVRDAHRRVEAGDVLGKLVLVP